MTKYYAVMDFPESDGAQQWKTLFRTLDEAAAAVEENHHQNWIDAEMEGDGELYVTHTTGNCLYFGLKDTNVEWLSWVVTEVTLED